MDCAWTHKFDGKLYWMSTKVITYTYGVGGISNPVFSPNKTPVKSFTEHIKLSISCGILSATKIPKITNNWNFVSWVVQMVRVCVSFAVYLWFHTLFSFTCLPMKTWLKRIWILTLNVLFFCISAWSAQREDVLWQGKSLQLLVMDLEYTQNSTNYFASPW